MSGIGSSPAERAPSQAPGNPLRDDLLWTRFRQAASPLELYPHWLAIQCQLAGGVSRGFLLTAQADGALNPAATWPAGAAVDAAVTDAAERALRERLIIVVRQGGELIVAMPIESGAAIEAMLVLCLASRAEAELQYAIRLLSWGNGWLQRDSHDSSPTTTLPATFAHLLASPIEQQRFAQSASAFLNELSDQLTCSRVSLGLEDAGHVRLKGISHTAQFSARSDLVRLTEAAMNEALDRDALSAWSSGSAAAGLPLPAHEELARWTSATHVLSIPFARGEQTRGVMTLERNGEEPLAGEQLALVHAAVAITGPLLDLQHAEEQWLIVKAWQSLRRYVRQLIATGHLTLKTATAGAIALLAVLTLIPANYRVSADAVLEPSIRIAAAAPYDGFIAKAPVRAGETVRKGDLLVELDDREYRLERVRWDSEFQHVARQYRQALAEEKSADAEILSAQMDQAQAQLSLAEDRLARSAIRAAVDGIVVTGDLSKEIGSPVTRGQVLFEVAPLDQYRLILKVDESDIDDIAVGQTGTLVLAAAPNKHLDLAVQKITPVSEAAEGKNTFRVEAQIAATPGWLRPGMEGVGKVGAGDRSLLWIWTHDLIDWLRLKLWRWLP